MTTPAPASPTAQPSQGQASAPPAHGWEAIAIWIVLVGAFMALLDSM